MTKNLNNCGLTRLDTKMLQGLSVLAMVLLHLFDRVDYAALYTPILYLGGHPVIFYIAQLSDFCVMGYAFCSGYALYKQYGQKREVKEYYQDRLRSLKILLMNYWIILFLFTIVSVVVKNGKQMPGSLLEFIGNFTTVKTTYNGAWWYLFIYILLVLISSFIFKCCNKVSSWLMLVITFVIYISAYYIRFYYVSSNWFIIKYGVFGMTLFEFMIGAICAKEKWIEKARRVVEKVPVLVRVVVSCVLIAGMLIGHTLILPSLFVAPFTGLVIIFIFSLWQKPLWMQQIFLCLGKHSTNIWLIHMFFYLYIFKDFVFVGRYPIVILLLMLAVTIGCSEVIQRILKSWVVRMKWV